MKHLFEATLNRGEIVILDGAMGTMLQAMGMPAGVSPDLFCMKNPDILQKIHNAYIDAGSSLITSCTFGANPFKLKSGDDTASFNEKLASITVECARRASQRLGHKIFAAGNIGPSGLFAKPLGDILPAAMLSGYKKQICGLAAAGVDLLFIETQFDLAETRTIVAAAREVCDLPVMVSMTFENGVNLTGTTPRIFAYTMQNMGADVIGTNCSLGPDEMLPVVEELLQTCAKPVLAEPNAGLPVLKNGSTVFPQKPEEFAQKTSRFAAMGVQVLGGCCGTTPDHIRCLAEKLHEYKTVERKKPPINGICLTSRTKLVKIADDAPFTLIGERINPTGKTWLIKEFQDGNPAGAVRLADEQAMHGAAVLDINSGAPLCDETALLPRLVEAISSRTDIPLCLDSSNAEALQAALPWYAGSCLINSISGEKDRMAILGPVCKKYGTPFILLPIKGGKLPEKADERIKITEELLEEAHSLAIPDSLILVDVLALAVSSNQHAAKECLKMLAWCKNQKLSTTIGLSNISFGLPARDLVNTTFLCMAAGAGLVSCIANPGDRRLREALASLAVLDGTDGNAAQFIAGYGTRADESPKKPETDAVQPAAKDELYNAILGGDVENILNIVDKELAFGKKPYFLINEVLIPAITQVGNLYESREYFLPQLIRSAEAMKKAVARLTPLLEKSGEGQRRPVIVLATVEGDIHDIGKNIVALLLSNHGFEIVDAGTDVPAQRIVDCAMEHKASIIGLSALMTTTMPRMEDTVRLVREKGLPIKIMVGGAAVTQDFANAIGADAYCGDAVDSVRISKKFTE